MDLAPNGYLRPFWRGSEQEHGSRDDERLFNAVCPGVGIDKRRIEAPGATDDPVFGPFISAWTAWASDPGVRWRGSSAGVLTAISAWLLERGTASEVIGAGMSADAPRRTVPIRLQTRDEVLATAGSRYAPVGTTELFDTAAGAPAFVGKPCEVYAARRLSEGRGRAASEAVLLSFFCAGVPSQLATDRLITRLGKDPGRAREVRYRGHGWPGNFVVRAEGGERSEVSYEESWGKHLGPFVQDRCKICPDGTGGDADIAVGDYWHSDSAGYPVFGDSPGISAAIARTMRGHELLMEAAAEGVIALEPLALANVAAVQPLQTKRRAELPGRLLGRVLAGKPVPRYRGFTLVSVGLKAPKVTARAARGAFARARRAKKL